MDDFGEPEGGQEVDQPLLRGVAHKGEGSCPFWGFVGLAGVEDQLIAAPVCDASHDPVGVGKVVEPNPMVEDRQAKYDVCRRRLTHRIRGEVEPNECYPVALVMQ